MPSTCIVKGCRSRQIQGGQIRFFRLPWRNEVLLREWLVRAGFSRNELTRANFGKFRNLRICSLHFDGDSSPTAGSMPSLNIAGIKSNDPQHPDYTPSLFPNQTTAKDVITKTSKILQRYRRVRIRSTHEIIAENQDDSSPIDKQLYFYQYHDDDMVKQASNVTSGYALRRPDIDLFMECHDDDLSQWQIEAARKAQDEYQAALAKVKAIKAAEVRAACTPAPMTPDVMIVGQSPPTKNLNVLKTAVSSNPVNVPSKTFASTVLSQKTLPLMTNTPVSVTPKNAFAEKVAAALVKAHGNSLQSGSGPSNLNPNVVQGTYGMGVKRSAASLLEEQLTVKKKPVNRKENDDSENWVPLEEYYYGKIEGNPLSDIYQKGEFRFKCWYCSKMLYNNVRTMMHMQAHINSEKQQNLDLSDLTQCKHCYKQFDTPYDMQTHVEKVHMGSTKVLMCRICEKDHESQASLAGHMRVTHTAREMPYVCQVCAFRSSMYSDVVDHFKKKHDSMKYLLCLYCLKTYSIHFVTNGWGQTQAFYHHLLKHQSKSASKKCSSCKLTFFSVNDLKAHRKRDHESNEISGVGVQSKCDSSDQVMIKLPDNAQNLKSLNAPWASKHLDLGTVRLPPNLETINCMECKMPLDSPDHFRKYMECSNCRFATNCNLAYANHMFSFHSGPTNDLSRISKERTMPAPMFCCCGYNSHYGNKIANHMVYCSKRTCYKDRPETLVDSEEDGDTLFHDRDPRRKPGATLLNVLGLIKKQTARRSKRRPLKSASKLAASTASHSEDLQAIHPEFSAIKPERIIDQKPEFPKESADSPALKTDDDDSISNVLSTKPQSESKPESEADIQSLGSLNPAESRLDSGSVDNEESMEGDAIPGDQEKSCNLPADTDNKAKLSQNEECLTEDSKDVSSEKTNDSDADVVQGKKSPDAGSDTIEKHDVAEAEARDHSEAKRDDKAPDNDKLAAESRDEDGGNASDGVLSDDNATSSRDMAWEDLPENGLNEVCKDEEIAKDTSEINAGSTERGNSEITEGTVTAEKEKDDANVEMASEDDDVSEEKEDRARTENEEITVSEGEIDGASKEMCSEDETMPDEEDDKNKIIRHEQESVEPKGEMRDESIPVRTPGGSPNAEGTTSPSSEQEAPTLGDRDPISTESESKPPAENIEPRKEKESSDERLSQDSDRSRDSDHDRSRDVDLDRSRDVDHDRSRDSDRDRSRDVDRNRSRDSDHYRTDGHDSSSDPSRSVARDCSRADGRDRYHDDDRDRSRDDRHHSSDQYHRDDRRAYSHHHDRSRYHPYDDNRDRRDHGSHRSGYDHRSGQHDSQGYRSRDRYHDRSRDSRDRHRDHYRDSR